MGFFVVQGPDSYKDLNILGLHFLNLITVKMSEKYEMLIEENT